MADDPEQHMLLELDKLLENGPTHSPALNEGGSAL